ncbi:outer membrane protein [Legionella worsleiensis]|uniref:Outer membrane protein beta-barrel domain-containing protein n=1 Tax=Legionella worsleiensis TaxID=45076 RepID=A0A0W1AFX6_9GAMM|nr:outer membrane beta-barrel protein [Legionella worsleiensis]KTD80241.1 hypothetical protein Lwor_1149 [Legionella worsleiensis]STY31663.1 Opacity protein and related surface antigens [Legionella worsleiensis]
MNQLSIITKSALLTLFMTSGINAENYHSNSAFIHDWTGFYAGFNGQLDLNNAQLNSQQLGFTNPSGICNTNKQITTYSPGVQLGFLHQFFNNFVSGIEASSFFNTKQNTLFDCNCPTYPEVSDQFIFKNKMHHSLKARLGTLFNWDKNQVLPYILAGASFADYSLAYSNEGNDYFYQVRNKAAPLFGAGIEWAFMNNWTLRAEYSYTNYGTAINLQIPSIYGLLDPEGNARLRLNSNTMQIAISYWI